MMDYDGRELTVQAVNYCRNFTDGAGRSIDELTVYATDSNGRVWTWCEHHYQPDQTDPQDKGVYASAKTLAKE